MDKFRNNGKEKKSRHFWIKYLTKFDQYENMILILCKFCANFFFFKGWCELIRRGDNQGGVINR